MIKIIFIALKFDYACVTTKKVFKMIKIIFKIFFTALKNDYARVTIIKVFKNDKKSF
jgi:hypothetical protein